MTTDNNGHSADEDRYVGNIWGWKWSLISLAIICFFILLALCRYVIVQPEQLIDPAAVEQFG